MVSQKPEIEIERCGTTIDIDLTSDTFCRVKVLLGNSEIRRILEATLDLLPPKHREKLEQPLQATIKGLATYDKQLDISILPVTNKKALQERKALKV